MSSYMNMTCPKCPSATSTPNTASVVIRSVSFCTWTESQRSKTVHGMIVDSVGMDQTVKIDTLKRSSVKIICLAFVQRALRVNSSSKLLDNCNNFFVQPFGIKLIYYFQIVLNLIYQLLML